MEDNDFDSARFRFAECCDITYIIQQQQAIINGQPRIQEIRTPCIACPSCKTTVAQLPPETREADVAKVCAQQLRGAVNYCSKCGQKLSFPVWYSLGSQHYNISDK